MSRDIDEDEYERTNVYRVDAASSALQNVIGYWEVADWTGYGAHPALLLREQASDAAFDAWAWDGFIAGNDDLDAVVADWRKHYPTAAALYDRACEVFEAATAKGDEA